MPEFDQSEIDTERKETNVEAINRKIDEWFNPEGLEDKPYTVLNYHFGGHLNNEAFFMVMSSKGTLDVVYVFTSAFGGEPSLSLEFRYDEVEPSELRVAKGVFEAITRRL